METAYVANIDLRINTDKLIKDVDKAIAGLRKKLSGVSVNLGTEKSTKALDTLKRKLDQTTKKLRTSETALKKVTNQFRRLQTQTKRTTKSGEKFSGLLNEWWKRFGQVGIAFTVVYRLMNAVEQAIGKLSETIRKAIVQAGELVSTQSKMALWAVILSDGAMSYADAFDRAAINTRALAEASVTAISTLEELNVGIDEAAQAGVLITENLMPAFASLIDFTQMVALTTGSATRQVRQELQALAEGQVRATNILVRTALRFKILSEQDIQNLKDMTGAAEIFEKLMLKIHEHWDLVKEKMIRGDVSVGLKMWEKSIIQLLMRSEQLASVGEAVQSIFGEVAFKHLQKYQKELKDPSVTTAMRERVVLMQGLRTIFDVALTGFEKMFSALGKLAVVVKNLWPEIKTTAYWFGVWTLSVTGVMILEKLPKLIKVLFRPLRTLNNILKTTSGRFLAIAGGVYLLIPALQALADTWTELSKRQIGPQFGEKGWEPPEGAWKTFKKHYSDAKADLDDLLSTLSGPLLTKAKDFLSKLLDPGEVKNFTAAGIEGLRSINKAAINLEKRMEALGNITTDFQKRLKDLIKEGEVAKVIDILPWADREIRFELDQLNKKIKEYTVLIEAAAHAGHVEYAEELELALAKARLEVEGLNEALKDLPAAPGLAEANIRLKFSDLPALDKLEKIIDAFTGTSERFVQKVDKAGNVFYQKVKEGKDVLGEMFAEIIESLAEDLSIVATMFSKTLGSIGKWLGNVLGKFADGLGDISHGLGGTVGAIISLVLNLDKVIEKIADLPDMFARVFADFGDNLSQFGQGFVNLSEGLGEFVAELGTGLGDLITGIIDAISELGSNIGEAIPQLIEGIIEAIPQIVRALIKLVGNALYGTAKDSTKAMFNWLTGGGDDDTYVEVQVPHFEREWMTALKKLSMTDVGQTLVDLNLWFTKQREEAERLMAAYPAVHYDLTILEDLYASQVRALKRSLKAAWKDVYFQATLSDLAYQLKELQKWYDEQAKSAEELGQAIGWLNKAYDAQINLLKEQATGDWQDIIREHTLSDYALGLYELNKWYAEQLEIANLLDLALDDLNLAYELQKEALIELKYALDDTIASINAMIDELTGGKFAPVQSAEFYMSKYAELLAAAADGAAESVDALLGYIPEYVDFMAAFGGDYATLTASIITQLEALKLSFPALQSGGWTTGPSLAGESGVELVIPTYEPEHSGFLETVGMEPDAIGEAVAKHLAPLVGTENVIVIDGKAIGTVVAKQYKSHTELIENTRGAVKWQTPRYGTI